MPAFNESQLEKAFVELFKKEGYDYVYGESILRDTRDVILYDDLRFYLRKKYEVDHITEDEINRAIARLETSDGGSVYAENVEALRLLQEGFSLKRTNPKLPNLHIYPIDYTEVNNNELGKNNIFKFVNQLVIDGEHHRIPDGIVLLMVCLWWYLNLKMPSSKIPQ